MTTFRSKSISEDTDIKDYSIIKYISITDRFIKAQLDEKLYAYGLNNSNFMFLIKIGSQDNITQDKLMAASHIHPSNVTRGLATLEKNGYITRGTSAEDRRTFVLNLTQKGRDMLDELRRIISSVHNEILDCFEEDERRLLEKLLERMLNGIIEKRA